MSWKSWWLSIAVMIPFSVTFGQSENIEMADVFRAEGKIYVVVAVILVLLIGLFIYLFRVELSITKLERKIDEVSEERESLNSN